jgi:predicted aspartyl protease
MVIEGICVKADGEDTGGVAATHVTLPAAVSSGSARPCDDHNSVNAALDASGIDYTFTWIHASVGAMPIRAIVDTGSSLSLISLATARKLGLLDCVDRSSLEFYNAGGQKMVPKGVLNDLPLTMGPITQRHSFLVVDVDAYEVVLGIDFLGPLKVKIDMQERALRVKMDASTIITIPLHFGVGSVPNVNFMYRHHQGQGIDDEPPPLETIPESSEEGSDCETDSDEEANKENCWPTEPKGSDDLPAGKGLLARESGLGTRTPLAPLHIDTTGSRSSQSSADISNSPQSGSHESISADEFNHLSLSSEPPEGRTGCGARHKGTRGFGHDFPWHYGFMTEALIRQDFPAFDALVSCYQCVTSPWPREGNWGQIEQCSNEVNASLSEDSLRITDGRSLNTWEVAPERKIYVLNVQGKGEWVAETVDSHYSSCTRTIQYCRFGGTWLCFGGWDTTPFAKGFCYPTSRRGGQV